MALVGLGSALQWRVKWLPGCLSCDYVTEGQSATRRPKKFPLAVKKKLSRWWTRDCFNLELSLSPQLSQCAGGANGCRTEHFTSAR